MKRQLPLIGALLLPVMAGAVAASPAGGKADMPGVIDPAQARLDYMLKCQGCHRPDGSGDAVSNPPMNGKVAKFLHVPGGRAFLGRVPGVATVDLDDTRLSNVVNWTLYRFDRANLPPGFKPYTPAEIGRLRQSPLRTERAGVRAALVAQMPGGVL
ncbi:MAG: cytochrome C [Sphingomonadales bacterium]|jgi:hypothetical protein|nr:cytochrome C [Sphingomonadales bacterium]